MHVVYVSNYPQLSSSTCVNFITTSFGVEFLQRNEIQCSMHATKEMHSLITTSDALECTNIFSLLYKQ